MMKRILFVLPIVCGVYAIAPFRSLADDPPQVTYTWSVGEGYRTQSYTPNPPPGWVKPGDTINYSLVLTDKDRYDWTDSGGDHHEYPADTMKPTEWRVVSQIGSTMGLKTGDYKAGNNGNEPPSADKSVDYIRCTADDKPDPKDPAGDGTRDDDAFDKADYAFAVVSFPVGISQVEVDSVVQGAGQAWTQTSHWVVTSQWGTGLPGVTVSESPSTWCTHVPGHDSSCHLSGSTSTGVGTTNGEGKFTDTFGATFNGTGKAVTIKQSYSVAYGTYSHSAVLVYLVKIIHWRDDPGTVFHIQDPSSCTESEQNCASND